MISFITANLSTIIVSAVLVAVVSTIIIYMIKEKRKGKSSCGCSCSSCPSGSICHANTSYNKK